MDFKDKPTLHGRDVGSELDKPAYDSLKANSSRALTAGQVRARMAPVAEQSGDKGAILSVSSAFLIGVALGLAGQAQQGEPAHVGLSLGDDDNSDTKDKKECNREFDLGH